jgi:hypothetical protein
VSLNTPFRTAITRQRILNTAGTPMADHSSSRKETDFEYNASYRKFIRLFKEIEENAKLFPKECKTCGKGFRTYSQFISETIPKGHVMEDCKDVMQTPFTMMYRHCMCGNTLVLTLTEETSPWLDELWEMLEAEAERTGKPIRSIVEEFTKQCDEIIVSEHRSFPDENTQ